MPPGPPPRTRTLGSPSYNFPGAVHVAHSTRGGGGRSLPQLASTAWLLSVRGVVPLAYFLARMDGMLWGKRQERPAGEELKPVANSA